MGLTYLTKKWLEKRGGNLTTFTIDHGSKTEYSEKTDKILSSIKKWNINSKILTLTIKNFLKNNRFQEEARKNRYEILIKNCKKYKIKYLLLGHQIEDQAETNIIRFIKGTGISGLKGIKPVGKYSDVYLLRPLLKFSKNQIRSILPKNQSWIEDKSNKSNQYIRNRIRFFLKTDSFVNVKQISRNTYKYKRIDQFIDRYTKLIIKNKVKFFIEGYALFDFFSFQRIDSIILERTLSTIIYCCSGKNYPPRYKQILKIIEILKKKNYILNITCNGCLLKMYKKKILVVKDWQSIAKINCTP